MNAGREKGIRKDLLKPQKLRKAFGEVLSIRLPTTMIRRITTSVSSIMQQGYINIKDNPNI